jgi:hypothetical protein
MEYNYNYNYNYNYKSFKESRLYLLNQMSSEMTHCQLQKRGSEFTWGRGQTGSHWGYEKY